MAWFSFGAFPCRGGELDDNSRVDVVEIARVPDMLPSLFPSWSGYGLISTPDYNTVDKYWDWVYRSMLCYLTWIRARNKYIEDKDVPVQVMKKYGGNGGIRHLFRTWEEEVSSQHQASFTLLRNPLNRRLGGSQRHSGQLRKENTLPLQGIEPQINKQIKSTTFPSPARPTCGLFLWRNNRTRAPAASLLRYRDHAQTHHTR